MITSNQTKTSSAGDYSLVDSRFYSNSNFIDENCTGTVEKVPLSVETLSLIRDSFPSFGCSVLTFNKNKSSTNMNMRNEECAQTSDRKEVCGEWVKSYAVIKGRHIFLTTNEKDQIPFRALPLDRITFHMHENGNENEQKNKNGNGNEKKQSKSIESAEHDYSQFEIQVVTKRMVMNRHGEEVRGMSGGDNFCRISDVM
jgi:hypothetical protein